MFIRRYIVKEMCYICIMEFYLVIKENEIIILKGKYK